MTGNLLGKAKDFFKARQTGIAKTYSDARGDYAFLVWIEGAEGHSTPFVVTAKQYLNRRDDVRVASFFRRKVVERAADMDARLLQFVARGSDHLVFDPDAVLQYGVEPGEESSRKQQGEDWIDIPAAWGCSLQDFADRRDSPRTAPADDDPLHDLVDPTDGDGGQPTLEDYNDE